MFPSIDDTEQWQRLNPEVKKFTKWLFKPTKIQDEPYKSIIEDQGFSESKLRKI
jgi:ABC-type xylose transport system substrate-binding protein